MRLLLVTAWTAIALLGVEIQSAAAESAQIPPEFARVDHDSDGKPRALQLAVMQYAPSTTSSELVIDLISAVHIGDRAYYQSLNERFRKYDALLYELVIANPDNYEMPPDADRGFLSNMQIQLKDALGLAFQLEEIDYRAGNFVHADMSADMLFRSMDERGESLYVYFWRLFYAALDQYARDPLGVQDMQMMSQLFFAPDEDALKIVIAHEMVKATHSGDFLGGNDGSAVISARNAHAVEVLKSQIASGASRIGIFYGAAHMADFDGRMVNELGMRRTDVEWTDAWLFDASAQTPP